jgi:hypothetical protein
VRTLPLDLAVFAGLPAVPDDAVTHGEVFTRRWVVETILDLADWRPDQDLAHLRLIEPACGTGAFLRVISERVSDSLRKFDRALGEAVDSVRAFDLLPANVATSRRMVRQTFTARGWCDREASAVADAWVQQGDYLLSPPCGDDADVVVGNPPYIRLEDLPEPRAKVYRSLWPTMVGRADIYVGFIEAGLKSLRAGGVLAFICADRWMRNQYGRRLRELVAEGFAVETVIGMHDVDAFEHPVSAYPAIVVLRRGPQAEAVVADTTGRFDGGGASELVSWSRAGGTESAGTGWRAARVSSWRRDSRPWPATSPSVAAALADLSERFPALDQPASHVRVGIGVATGADRVYITRDGDLVESDLLLPLALATDTATGTFVWSRHYLVNPWAPDGRLVSLADYPLLRRHVSRHAETLRARHVGRRRPDQWYRTIDKVDRPLLDRPKLLFPDLKATSHPVLESGGHYPHHNLYWLSSEVWNLEVLGGLLLSRVAEAFIDAYGVKMRGGTLRFQAQYLRMIHVPTPESITRLTARALRTAFQRRDPEAATAAALAAYGLASWPRAWKV